MKDSNKITRKNISWIRKNSNLIVIFFITFILLEVTLRLLEEYYYKQSQTQLYKNIYSDERDKPYLFGHKPNINVLFEKGYYNFTFITNSEGLRATEDYSDLDKSIIFLGDSVVEGWLIENDEMMSYVFENKTGLKTLNFGVGSSNTVQEYFFLKEKYRAHYNTKLIILCLSINDVDQNSFRRFFDPTVSNWRLYDYLKSDGETGGQLRILDYIKNVIRKSKTLSTFYHVLKDSYRKQLKTSNQDPIYSDHNLLMTKIYIGKIRNFASQIGSEFIVVMFPLKFQLKNQYKPGGRYQDQLIHILNNEGIQSIDLYEPLKDAVSSSPKEKWFYDVEHPYKIGHKFIGEYLSDELSSRFPDIFLAKRQPEKVRQKEKKEIN